MEFEITTIRDDGVPRRRMIIDKMEQTFPVIHLTQTDAVYDGYEAETFRRARDDGFALIADKCQPEYFKRRFIQNTTFIADTLEVELKRDNMKDRGFAQHISLAIVQVHGRPDPTSVPVEATHNEADALEALLAMYQQNGLSIDNPDYLLMEQLIRQTPRYLGVKKPKYDILNNAGFGFTIQYRTQLAKKTELFSYVLGFKQKRRTARVSPDQHRFP